MDAGVLRAEIRRIRTMSFGRAALLVAVIGTVHALLYVPLVHPHENDDSPAYLAAAHALLHGSYSTPISASSYPAGGRVVDYSGLPISDAVGRAIERQSFRTPGYPLLLAAVGGGRGSVSRGALFVVQALLFGAGVMLLALTVRRWFGAGIGLLAAALYALDPFSKRYVALVLTEVVTGFLLVAAAYAFTRGWQTRSSWWWASAGALVGAATIVRPVFVLAVPLLALAGLVSRGSAGQRVKTGAVTAAVALAVLAPWVAHQQATIGRTTLSSFGEGLNLLMAAHGEGLGRTAADVSRDPSFVRDFTAPHRHAPSASRMEADPEAHARYIARADGAYRDSAWSLYRGRLEHDPGRVVWETLYRCYFLWMAHEDWFQPGGIALVPLRLFDWSLLILAAAGAVIAIRAGGPARAIAWFLLAYTVVLGTHHVEARFAIPVRGLFLSLVALPLAVLYARVARRPLAGLVPLA